MKAASQEVLAAATELAVVDERVDQAVEAIAQAASSGKIGDGKIFITALEQALRIRTGETDNHAL